MNDILLLHGLPRRLVLPLLFLLITAFQLEATGSKIADARFLHTPSNSATAAPAWTPICSGEGYTVQPLSRAIIDIDMGRVPLGSAKDSTADAILENTGIMPINVSDIRIEGAHAADFTIVAGFAPFVLEPGESATVVFSFKPLEVGERSAVVVIDNDAIPLEVDIRGEGIPQELAIDAGPYILPQTSVGVQSSDTLELLLSNLTGADLRIDSITVLAPHMDVFSVIDGNAPAVIGAEAFASVRIGMLSENPGVYRGRVGIWYNGHDTPVIVFIEGQVGDDVVSVQAEAQRASLREAFHIAPNPIRNSASALVRIPRSAHSSARLDIYDAAGRMVRSYAPIPADAAHELRISTSGLTSGMYYCALTIGGLRFVKNLLVTR